MINDNLNSHGKRPADNFQAHKKMRQEQLSVDKAHFENMVQIAIESSDIVQISILRTTPMWNTTLLEYSDEDFQGLVTPLQYANLVQKRDIVKLLFDDYPTQESSYFPLSTLGIAMENDMANTACELIGQSTPQFMEAIKDKLIDCVCYYENLEWLEASLSYGFLNKEEDGPSVFFMALESYSLKMVDYLIKNQWPLEDDEFNSTEETALFSAIDTGNLPIIEKVLEYCDQTFVEDNFHTYCKLAIRTNQLEVVRLLQQRFDGLKFMSEHFENPISIAIEYACKAEMVAYFLDQGVTPSISFNTHEDDWLMCFYHGLYDIAKLLIPCIQLTFELKQVALTLAVRKKQWHMIDLSVELGADVTLHAQNFEFPLYYAIENNDKKCIKKLLYYGATLYEPAIGQNPRSIYRLIVEKGNTALLDMILKKVTSLNALPLERYTFKLKSYDMLAWLLRNHQTTSNNTFLVRARNFCLTARWQEGVELCHQYDVIQSCSHKIIDYQIKSLSMDRRAQFSTRAVPELNQALFTLLFKKRIHLLDCMNPFKAKAMADELKDLFRLDLTGAQWKTNLESFLVSKSKSLVFGQLCSKFAPKDNVNSAVLENLLAPYYGHQLLQKMFLIGCKIEHQREQQLTTHLEINRVTRSMP